MEAQPRLAADKFQHVIRYAPLFSIDLLVKNDKGRFLLGLRTNAPARDFWFVPGGRVFKNEPLAAAFERISLAELGTAVPVAAARLVGLFDHFYENNVFSADFGTHYIVAAHALTVERLEGLSHQQHSAYRWATPEEIVSDTAVHRYTREYFSAPVHSELSPQYAKPLKVQH